MNSKIILCLVLGLSYAHLDAAVSKTTAKALFCAYGSVGRMPKKPPPGFESQFAVAVIEIHSPSEIKNMSVSDFVLLDQAGKATKFKRVVSVAVFERLRVATDGDCAYYLNPGGTHPWNGTLPAGKICLRITVALIEEPIAPVRFRLTVGGHAIEGAVDCAWPT